MFSAPSQLGRILCDSYERPLDGARSGSARRTSEDSTPGAKRAPRGNCGAGKGHSSGVTALQRHAPQKRTAPESLDPRAALGVATVGG